MKCTVRADWRPPKISINPGKAASRRGDIGYLLKHVVAKRLLPGRKTQAQVVPDSTSQAAEVAARREQVPPQMPTQHAIEDINQAVQYENPGKEEVPQPPFGKRLPRRQCRPGRKRARYAIAVTIP